MNRLVTGNRAPSAPEGAKMLTRADPSLDRPMILLQYIVEILHRSVLAVFLQNALVFELHNRQRVRGMLVGVDDSRRRMVLSAQSLCEKALSRCCVALADRRKSIVAPVESTARYKYTHLPLTRM